MQTAKGKVYTGYWLNGKMFGDSVGMSLNQTERHIEKSPEEPPPKSQTLSLYEKPQTKLRPKVNNSNAKTISKSKSRSPGTFKSKSKSKKRLIQKSPER
jgi:hypothetical protein